MVSEEGRYLSAAHSIQTAVKMQIEVLGENGAGADPKHLRTGLNMVMSDHAALARLLMKKGIITNDEYMQAITEGTEEEAERMAADTRKKCGLPDTVQFR